MTDFLTRFAPSPTGRLHLGHVTSALAVWRAAEAAGGPAPILRIEDTDVGRCKPEFEAHILEDLAWLGFEWQAGVRRQSEHFGAYETALNLLESHGLLYKCFRSRKSLAEAGETCIRNEALPHDKEQELLEKGQLFALRLSLSKAREFLGPEYDRLYYTEQKQGKTHVVPVDLRHTSDIVLKRKDSPASYNLASVYDDAAAQITHIIRGTDLIDAAPVHTLLQVIMGWPKPTYIHHRLLLGPDGKKLAKRDKSTSLATLRKEGLKPADIIALADGHD